MKTMEVLNESKDEANKKAYFPKTVEDNWEFNTKTKIPEGMTIGYIDGNPKNTVFANLKLVAIGTREIENNKKAEKAKKELAEVEAEKAKKDDKK